MNFKPRSTHDGSITETSKGWRLGISAGRAGQYRLAQLDDQQGLRRSRYLWRAPVRLELRARVGAQDYAGTWGFGFWNDPYGFSWGPGEGLPRFPTLPQAVWFFHASPSSYLSFRDDLPGNGFYAQVFRSPRVHARIIPAVLFLPFAPRQSRRILSQLILEQSSSLPMDATRWHSYVVHWRPEGVDCDVDGRTVLSVPVSPIGPLGCAIWIDNQYAAFDPRGKIRWGAEANKEAQVLEIEDLRLETQGRDGGSRS